MDSTHKMELSNVMDEVVSLKSHNEKLETSFLEQTAKLEEQKVVSFSYQF